MKLAQLHEATYYGQEHPVAEIADEILDGIAAREYETDWRHVDGGIKDVPKMIKTLSKRFSAPVSPTIYRHKSVYSWKFNHNNKQCAAYLDVEDDGDITLQVMSE